MTNPAAELQARLRRLTLARQGLADTAPFGHGVEAAMRAIERLGYVQIDTLSVVERAHHHVLGSRVPDYDPGMLHRLLAERRVFEYWSHAASYLPIDAYRFTLPRRQAVRSGSNRYYAAADPTLMAAILDRIRHDGPLRMRQFGEAGAARSGSWNWGPIRQAFDRLFMQGDLMVVERRGMEKSFDLVERWLPPDIDDRMPDAAEIARHLLDRAIDAHGAVRRDQLSYTRPGKPVVAAIEAEIVRRLADRDLIEIPVVTGPSYLVPSTLWEAPVAGDAGTVRILSPFDNCLIHRDRLSQLFGFDYRLECYVPEAKRRFGYFSLPVLYRDGFAGQVDCKADRGIGRLIVQRLHLTGGREDDPVFRDELISALDRFAAGNGCHQVEVGTAVHSRYGAIASALSPPSAEPA